MPRGNLALFVANAVLIFDRNDKRDQVLKLIESQPGLTLYDINRYLGFNIGTTRYHLLVLSMNHHIISFDYGTKFVRYFKNSGTFSDNEKLIISLLRHSYVKEILQAMLKHPGISNESLAADLHIQEPKVSRCLRMLASKGVVTRTTANGEKAAYRVKAEYVPVITSCLRFTEADSRHSALKIEG